MRCHDNLIDYYIAFCESFHLLYLDKVTDKLIKKNIYLKKNFSETGNQGAITF